MVIIHILVRGHNIVVCHAPGRQRRACVRDLGTAAAEPRLEELPARLSCEQTVSRFALALERVAGREHTIAPLPVTGFLVMLG